jgi:hypothetical protein
MTNHLVEAAKALLRTTGARTELDKTANAVTVQADESAFPLRITRQTNRYWQVECLAPAGVGGWTLAVFSDRDEALRYVVGWIQRDLGRELQGQLEDAVFALRVPSTEDDIAI